MINDTATWQHVYRMGPPITNTHPPTPPHPTNTPTPPPKSTHGAKIGALMPDISWAPPHSLPIQ